MPAEQVRVGERAPERRRAAEELPPEARAAFRWRAAARARSVPKGWKATRAAELRLPARARVRSPAGRCARGFGRGRAAVASRARPEAQARVGPGEERAARADWPARRARPAAAVRPGSPECSPPRAERSARAPSRARSARRAKVLRSAPRARVPSGKGQWVRVARASCRTSERWPPAPTAARVCRLLPVRFEDRKSVV